MGKTKVFRIPDTLIPPSEPLASVIAMVVIECACTALKECGYREPGENPFPDTGGCHTFYSPREWRDRGEDYGENYLLVVVHDGGEMSAMCSYMTTDFKIRECFAKHLENAGYWMEAITNWCTGIQASA